MEETKWYQEEWATDLFADIAKSLFAPKPKEQAPVTPQLGAKVSFEWADWIVPVTVISVVGVILLFVFLFIKGG